MPFVVSLDVSLDSLQAPCRSGTLSPFLIASNKTEKTRYLQIPAVLGFVVCF